MSDTKPYRETSPGDLITADLFNDIQVQTRDEIAKRIAEALAGVKEVDRARDSAKLEGKTAQEWADGIVDRALKALPARTGYRCVYKRLRWDEPAVITHGLKAYPLVDVCQLARFEVVASADEMQTVESVNWFLYHRTEMKIRRPKDDTGSPALITIEESRGPVFKHTFQSMLDLHGVKYTEQSTLGDVVTEFWKKLFSDPNDAFDETTFANSPWMDRCCGDRRTVESLKRGGEWNDLYLKVVPQRIVYAAGPLLARIDHYNLDEVGLTIMRAPSLADFAGARVRPGVSTAELKNIREADGQDSDDVEIPVMVLLKV
jgi:hypothetical protein